MKCILIRDIINIKDTNSAFSIYLNKAESDDDYISKFTIREPHLIKKVIKLILSSLGIDVIEHIVNLNNINRAVAYLQILGSSQCLFTTRREIKRFKELSSIQQMLLDSFVLLLKEGKSDYIIAKEDNQLKQDLNEKLFKYCSRKILKFLVSYLWQNKRIKPEEIKKVKDEIKEPYIIREDNIGLSQEMLEAVGQGDLNKVETLLTKGAEINYQDEEGNSALSISVKKGNIKILKKLIKYKADILESTKVNKKNILKDAINTNFPEILELLISKGILHGLTKDEQNEALVAAIKANNPIIVELLLSNGINADSQHSELRTTPILEVHYKSIPILKLLIKYKANLDRQDEKGETLIIKATREGNYNIVKLLLENGADPNIESRDCITAIIASVINHRNYIAKLLLQAGANPHKVNMEGSTAFLMAIERKRYGIINLIINNTKEFKYNKWYGTCLLIAALKTSSYFIIRSILKLGINPNVHYNNQKTIMGAVLEYGIRSPGDSIIFSKDEKTWILKLLLEYGADPNYRGDLDKPLSTSLVIAISNSLEACVKWLILYGAIIRNEGEGGDALKALRNYKNKKILKVIKKWVRLAERVNEFEDWINDIRDNIISPQISKIKKILRIKDKHEPRDRIKLAKETKKIGIKKTSKVQILERLTFAIENKKVEEFRRLLRRNKNLITMEDKSWLLYQAAYYEQIEVAKILLKNKVDINCYKECLERNPFYYAVLRSKIEFVKLFLEYNPDLNIRDGFNETLIFKPYNLEILKLLLARNAQVDARKTNGETLLIKSAKFGYENLVRLLISYDADPNLKNRNLKSTALHEAAEIGYYSIAKVLIEHEANLSIKDWKGETALGLAIKEGFKNIVRLILENNNIHTLSGEDLGKGLVWAAREGFDHIIRNLVKQKNIKDCPKSKIQEALMISVIKGFTENVRILLEQGFSLTNIKDKFGNTPLFYAAKNGHTEIIKLLLSYGASTKSINKSQVSIIEMAYQKGYISILRIMLEYSLRSKVMGVYNNWIITNSAFFSKYMQYSKEIN